jgi:hypothetical protein
MTPEEKRAQRLQLLEDHIGRALQDSLTSGELRAAPSWGRPLDFGDGYDETPAELRMPMKVLKDSGFVPPEVEVMHQIAALQQSLVDAPDDDETRLRRQRLSELRQHLALRLERLRSGGSL